MQFYLIWPLLFWGYCRLSKRKYKGDIVGNAKYRKLGKEVYQNAKRNDQRRGIAGVCFGGLALLSVFAMILRYVPGQDPSRVYYGTDTMAFMCFWEYCLAPCDRTIPFGVYNFRHSGVGFVV